MLKHWVLPLEKQWLQAKFSGIHQLSRGNCRNLMPVRTRLLAFYQLEQFIEYKPGLSGVPVEKRGGSIYFKVVLQMRCNVTGTSTTTLAQDVDTEDTRSFS